MLLLCNCSIPHIATQQEISCIYQTSLLWYLTRFSIKSTWCTPFLSYHYLGPKWLWFPDLDSTPRRSFKVFDCVKLLRIQHLRLVITLSKDHILHQKEASQLRASNVRADLNFFNADVGKGGEARKGIQVLYIHHQNDWAP